MFERNYAVGDLVIYRKTKHSTKPGPRAQHVEPARQGEEYAYWVDKFWVVAKTQGDHLLLQTRRGKTNQVRADDRNLRRARWWERMLYRGRFPSLESTDGPEGHKPSPAS